MTDLLWPTAPVQESEPPQPELPTQSPRRGLRTTAAAAGLSALVFGGIGVGVGAAMDHGDGSTSVLPAASLPSGSLSVVPTSYAGVAARVSPSVVNINVTTANGGDTGSGVILRSDGYILTNNHVIAAAVGGNARIAVTFNDGAFYLMGVKPGDYELTVAAQVLDALAVDAEPLRFSLAPTANGIGRSDLELRLKPRF